MEADFEGMVALIHNYQIKDADARVEQKERELIEAQSARHELRQNDSKARKLAQSILDMILKVKTA